jgi:phage-related holin
MASGEADTIVQAKKPEMNPWMKFLFAGTLIFVLIALFVATLLFTMIRRDRLKELQHHQALREITEKLKKQP